MLDNQELLLHEATENQSTEIQEVTTQTSNIEDVNEQLIEDTNTGKSAESIEKLETVEKTVLEELTLSDDMLIENETSISLPDEVVQQEEKGDDIPQESEIQEQVIDETKTQESNEPIAKEELSEIPMADYDNSMDLESIVNTLKSLIKEHPVQAIGKNVEELKRLFNVKFGMLLHEAKTSFMAENEETSEFHYENPIQKEYNDILYQYKKLRQQYYNEIEKNHESNLHQKNAIIDELKELIEHGNPDTMYKKFREIQLKWRNVGPVPRDNYADLWRTYHFHVERFYDLLHLSNELRDMDFKHNYDEKMKLVLRVELLAESEDVKAAFDELQILHRLWKEEIGPVSREHREEVWNRFSNATNKIHDRRHEYFELVKGEFEENLKKKEEILIQLDAINQSKRNTHNDWQRSLKEAEILRKNFIKTGRVPKANDKEIWEKFREINRIYNVDKNEFYKDIKKEQSENLDRKMKLVLQAEALRESEDWESTTEVMKHIQSEWKNIGHVPKQLSDKIWNRFKESCNHYFDKLHKAQDSIDEELMSVYIKKKAYLENLKTEAEKEGFTLDSEQLKAIVNEWKEMGSVPTKQRYIEGKFNKFLDPFFENLSSDKSQSSLIRYKNNIESYLAQKDVNKVYDEMQFVRKKLEFVTKEKQQMETNRLYFSNADDNNPMIRKILNNIEKLSLEMEVWNNKLQYLRTLDI
jgi:hypothetical protein